MRVTTDRRTSTPRVRWQVTVLALTCSAAMLGCGSSDNVGPSPIPGRQIRGSGRVIEQARTVADFSSVRHETAGRLDIRQTGRSSVRVRAEDNILEHIETTVESGVLVIRTRNVAVRPAQPIEISPTVEDLQRLEMTGAGDIVFDRLSTGRFELAHRGAGATTIDNVDAQMLLVDMGGAGDSTVSGRVAEQRVRLLGTGHYRGSRLESRVATVDVTGVGSATVLVRDRKPCNTSRGSSSR